MDEERERGRIAATATKRRESVAHAKAMMPHLHMAIKSARLTDRGASLRAIAEYLNTRAPPLRTLKGKEFGPESVRRMLLNTEKHIAKAAGFECYNAIRILEYKAKLAGTASSAELKAEIERLEAKRDADIAEGTALGHLLRLEDIGTRPKLTLQETAELIVYQHGYKRKRREWDDTKDSPIDGFDEWAVDLLKKALGG